MLVDIRISACPSPNAVMALSSSAGVIRPCADMILASGMSFVTRSYKRGMSSIRGHTTNDCPPRKRSRNSASFNTTLSHAPMKVLTAKRSTGGVAIIDI